MKKLYILLLLPFLALGQSQDQNYIKTTTYKVETATSISNPQPNQATVQVDYFDGTGRLIQQRAIKQAHNNGDIITHVGYDNLGRPTKSYMPYVASSSSLLYNANALQETQSFYNTPAYENTTNPYSEQLIEASPLGRVLKQGAPGSDWMINYPSSTTDHSVKFDYQSNNATEVRLFKVTTTKNSTTKVYDLTFVNSGYYVVNQLTKTIVKDENWKSNSGNNHTTQEFKNKQGQVVLKRAFENSLTRDTYYVYDDYGNLTYVIPPGVNTAATITQTILDDMCYQYKYDIKNRLVEKKLPAKDWEYIVYDKLDRPVLSGPVLTPFGGTDKGWMVSKFDAFGRIVYTGWMSDNTFTSVRRKDLQNTKDLVAEPVFETKLTSASNNNGVTIQYSNTVFPTGTYSVLTINYYDNYSYPGTPTVPSAVEGQLTLSNAKGLSTGSWTRVLNSSSVVGELSYVIYDYKARPVRTYQSNYLGGYSQTDSYLANGLLHYTITSHKRTSQDAVITVQENFEYSPQGRLLKHLHQLPNKDPELLAQNIYNPIGQLISKNVGGTDTSGSMAHQKVDYRYNIRGWLLEINDTQDLSNNSGIYDDLFAFKINYTTVENDLDNTVQGLYNGNISETFWRSAADNVLRKYGYSYDPMNRLLSAVYQKPGASVEVTNSYNESMSYDANGNIQMLQRTGEYDDQVQSLQIDNLEYFYHPTKKNQLMKVTDAANNPNGFKDDSDGTNDSTDDYGYDDFGNMNRDANKGILIVYYNHLNLPTTVEFANGKIEYLYNAAGSKLQKKVYEGTLITITDYLNGFQYVKTGSDDPRLEFFPHAEGYVKVTEGELFNYVYNFTDHLGNVRMSYGYDPADFTLKILEENHYYPFGLKHNNYNMTSRQYERNIIGGGVIISPVDKNAYKYKLNGKEYQDELGLNMYAMDMRQYDPAIGRWVVQDPVIHHNYSPYSAFDNNPVFWADPSGADSNMPEMFDGMGRNKFDSNGLYITPDDRGEADFDMMGYIRERNKGAGGGGKIFEFMLGHLSANEQLDSFKLYNSSRGFYSYESFFEDGPNKYQWNGAAYEVGGVSGGMRKVYVGGGLFGDILTGTEKHFNGGLGTLGVAVQGYNNIGNDVKRAYAYKLSKMTGVKSGQIFQGVKGFANSTGKLASKLGPVGTVLGGGVITYEVMSGTWDAHTVVNAGLMIGAGVATFFGAPVVLTGIALYGVGDYFFDFGGIIDRNVGRNSGVWKP